MIDFNPLADLIIERLRGSLAHDEVLTTAQVCELFQISRNEITALVQRGLPCVRLGNGYRYSRTAVMAWFYAQTDNPQQCGG